MRIAFFGATGLGYDCCRHIIEKNLAEVSAIFTTPKIFSISYSEKPVTNVNFADFHELGNQYGIPVIEVTGKMNSYTESVRQYHPDFLLVVGWYYMIPKSIRDIAPKGCAGFHASLLPKYRGGAPLVWAMINGEKETGITFFYFDDGIDSGDIIAQKKFSIGENETIKDLLKKTTLHTLEITEEFIPRIDRGNAPRTKQDESLATYVPQRKPDDGEINWTWNTERIKNFIRAQTKPYPGAFTLINGKKITIWEADITEE
jgi:methionyl-tRNA formyltransferase